jgi:isochorismate synthases
MQFDQASDYRIFDSFIRNDERFALYRLPGEQLSFMMQHSDRAVRIARGEDLNGKSGFAVMPFRIKPETPGIIIESETTVNGEKNIFDHLGIIRLGKSGHKKPIRVQSSAGTIELYRQAYNSFLSALKENAFKKLVLSRTRDVEPEAAFSAGNCFKKACEVYPSHFVFLVNTPETGAWMGISPELLLSEQFGKGKTVALAGTKGSEEEWDEKNRLEQQIVVDYMKEQLHKGGYNFTQTEPFSVSSGDIMHLKTEFSFDMKERNKTGDLLALLHPSPAVCGFPKEEAFHFIAKHEGYDRRYYSGFTGPLNREGRSVLYVNLRCMQIGEDVLRLYAGGGLLPSSRLEEEWKETENKLQAILRIIN